MTSATPSAPPSNVLDHEIRTFDGLAARWWDPKGEMSALHDINPLRIGYVERLAGGLKGRQALDIGCGGGLATEALAARGADALGIDLATEALKVATDHAARTGVPARYRAVAAEALAAETPGAYDVVTVFEMLEHVPDPGRVVEAAARLAKPGATLLFSTINRTPKAFALMIVGAEYVLRLIPRGTHTYAQFIRPSELAEAARRAGLVVTEIRGMRYHPLGRTAELTDDPSVNYFLAARKPAA